MPTYAELAKTLTGQAETALLGLWASCVAGRISRGEFVSAAALVVHAASSKVTGLADVALAARLTELTGTRVPPLGLAPADDTDAVQGELDAATASGRDGVGVRGAIGVVARAWPHAAGRRAWMTGIRASGAPGWRRVASGGCSLCARLAEADFLPGYIQMYEHKGCGCHPDPVMSDPQAA